MALTNVFLLMSFCLLFSCKKEETAPPNSPGSSVNSAPTAYFSYSPSTNLVAPVTVSFTNGSKGADSYVWTFDGTGRTLTTTDIALVFDEEGSYTVTLTAIGKGGRDTYSKVITVTTASTSNKPVANFTFSPSTRLVAPATVTFTNTSTNASSYKWDFSDGTASTETNPSKQFTKEGTYTVKLTATSAGNSSDVSKVITVGKGSTAPAVGKAVFWAIGTFSYVVISTEEVIFDEVGGGKTLSFAGGRIEKQFTSEPACETTGAYTTRRPANKYTFTATAYNSNGTKLASGAGDYIVVANGCTPVKLDFSTATASGQAIFWTDKSSGWSSIDITVAGSSAGSVTKYSSSAPSCGSSGYVTITRPPGTYAYTAKSNTGISWSGNVVISGNQCTNKQLLFPTTTDCKWDEWKKLIKITKFEFDQSGSYCGSSRGITYLDVQSFATEGLSIDFCFKSTKGTWDYCAFVDTGAGKLMHTNQCGKQIEVLVWARPFSVSASECPFPKP